MLLSCFLCNKEFSFAILWTFSRWRYTKLILPDVVLCPVLNMFALRFVHRFPDMNRPLNVMKSWSIFKLISCLNYYTHNTNKFDWNKTLISYSSSILCLYTFTFCTVPVSVMTLGCLSASISCKLINVAKSSQLWKWGKSENPFLLIYASLKRLWIGTMMFPSGSVHWTFY